MQKIKLIWTILDFVPWLCVIAGVIGIIYFGVRAWLVE